MARKDILTAGQLIEILGKLKPDQVVKFRSQTGTHQNDFVASNVEIKEDCVFLHGWMESIVYCIESEYQQFITMSVARDIREGGDVIKAIREELNIK